MSTEPAVYRITADPSDDGVLRARFNSLIRPYLVLYVAFILSMTVIGLPIAVIWLLGIGQWWARHYFDKLQCELGDTALRFRKGILFQVEKTVPLENIQDVTFIEGPVLRMFHLSVLKFETAGQSPGQAHQMSLVGIIDAREYRDRIIERREALKARTHVPAASVSTGSGEDDQVMLLRAILAKLDEIAKQLSTPRAG